MGLTISIIITFWAAFLIYKKYKAQAVLIIAGIILMLAAFYLGLGTILPVETAGSTPKGATGFALFDAFEFIKQTFSSRAAGLGLNIMAVGGFARYMEHIGASKALVKLTIKPLLRIHSPYIVMSATWVLGMFLGLAINSASGLAMLLMVTAFPILISLGVSRLSAVAVIATTLCLDWSPSDTGTILSANKSGIDPVTYWLHHQVPVALTVIPVVAILHYFTQKWMDKRDGHVVKATEIVPIIDKDGKPEILPPNYYAILPIIPLALILLFSDNPLALILLFSDKMIASIKMNIVIAMFISTSIAMICEYFRYFDGKKVTADLQVFFDGLGMQMANVVTLIVAGETFARGLTAIGTIDTIISAAQTSNFGAIGMSLVMITIIIVAAIIMGSGNAPFFAFAALVPNIATKMAIPPVMMLLPMHLAASSARAMSPITAVIVVSSSMGGVSPFDVVKRTAIPMLGSLATLVTSSFIYTHYQWFW